MGHARRMMPLAMMALLLGQMGSAKAQGVYTRDTGPRQKRTWSVEEAALEKDKGKATWTVPNGASAYYLLVVDQRGLIASAEHEETRH